MGLVFYLQKYFCQVCIMGTTIPVENLRKFNMTAEQYRNVSHNLVVDHIAMKILVVIVIMAVKHIHKPLYLAMIIH